MLGRLDTVSASGQTPSKDENLDVLIYHPKIQGNKLGTPKVTVQLKNLKQVNLGNVMILDDNIKRSPEFKTSDKDLFAQTLRLGV